MGARKLYSALIRLCSGIAKEARCTAVIQKLYQPLPHKAAKQSAIKLDHIWQIHIDGVFQGLGYHRMVASHAENAVSC